MADTKIDKSASHPQQPLQVVWTHGDTAYALCEVGSDLVIMSTRNSGGSWGRFGPILAQDARAYIIGYSHWNPRLDRNVVGFFYLPDHEPRILYRELDVATGLLSEEQELPIDYVSNTPPYEMAVTATEKGWIGIVQSGYEED